MNVSPVKHSLWCGLFLAFSASSLYAQAASATADSPTITMAQLQAQLVQDIAAIVAEEQIIQQDLAWFCQRSCQQV